MLFRLIFAGGFLALSSTQIAYQDALSLTGQEASPSARWQAHLVAANKLPKDEAARRHMIVTASADGTPVVLVPGVDPIVTGSLPPAADPIPDINRADKADAVVAKRPPAPEIFNAGVIAAPTLFAPVDPALPRTAFVVLTPNSSVAAAEPPVAPPAAAPAMPVPAPVALVVPKAPLARSKMPTPPSGPVATPPSLVVSAYASADDLNAIQAPFKAVIATPKSDPNILVPSVDALHAWVNDPLPPGVRSEAEIKCMADAIYFEARGEPEQGRLAVAQVVLNRVKNPAYPKTICGVVYQNRYHRYACQFSFACDGIADVVTDRASWADALQMARNVIGDEKTYFNADVGTSTHYHAVYVRPYWARTMKKMDRIGQHIFYKTYGGGWS